MKIEINSNYYPVTRKVYRDSPAHIVERVETGITVRAEIASRCLQGLLSTQYWASLPAKELAIIAIERADALIQELNESEKPE